MAYMMKPKDVPEGRYLSHGVLQNAYQRVTQSWGNGKGSWQQHKYLDKRWIDGTWRYLYELPKNVGQQVNKAYNTAKNAVSNTYNNAKKSVNDFRNYSTNVDKKHDKYQQQANRADERAQTAVDNQKILDGTKYFAVQDGSNAALAAEHELASYNRSKEYFNQQLEDANAYEASLWDRIRSGGVVNQSEWQKATDGQKAAQEALNQFEAEHRQKMDEYAKAGKEAAIKAKQAEDEKELWNAKYWEEFNKGAEAKANRDEAEKEQGTFKYKASQLLDNILDKADDITASGASWLQDQLESGSNWMNAKLSDLNEWATDMQEKVRESNPIASLSAKIENVFNNTDNPTIQQGLNILNQLIGWEDLSEANEIPNEQISRSTNSTGGRQYNGTSKKAEVQRTETQAEAADKYRAVQSEFMNLRDEHQKATNAVSTARETYGHNSEQAKAALDNEQRIMKELSAKEAEVQQAYRDMVTADNANGPVGGSGYQYLRRPRR